MGADRLSGAGQDGGEAGGSQTTHATIADGAANTSAKGKKEKENP